MFHLHYEARYWFQSVAGDDSMLLNELLWIFESRMTALLGEGLLGSMKLSNSLAISKGIFASCKVAATYTCLAGNCIQIIAFPCTITWSWRMGDHVQWWSKRSWSSEVSGNICEKSVVLSAIVQDFLNDLSWAGWWRILATSKSFTLCLIWD